MQERKRERFWDQSWVDLELQVFHNGTLKSSSEAKTTSSELPEEEPISDTDEPIED